MALSWHANQVILLFFSWFFSKDANFKCHLILSRTEGCAESTPNSGGVVKWLFLKLQKNFKKILVLNCLSSRMDHLCTRGNAEQLQRGFVPVLSTEVLWINLVLITLGPAGDGEGKLKLFLGWGPGANCWGFISLWICLGWVYTRISVCALCVY